jgi:peptide/nickel transport system permease protein
VYARVARAQTISQREKDYVEALRAVGATDRRIMVREILPNILAPLIVIASFNVAGVILSEASLSFLGLGVAEPTAAWGLMLSGNAADFYREAPWMILFPGAAISLAVFAFNLFGDSLRDFLDPRFKS